MDELEKKINKQFEIWKKRAIENLEKENTTLAMWEVLAMIDLKAQLDMLKEIKKKEEEDE